MLERKCVTRSQKPLPATACDFFYLFKKKKQNYNYFLNFFLIGILHTVESYLLMNVTELPLCISYSN